MKSFLIKTIILIVVLVSSYFSSVVAGDLYEKISGDPGTWVNLKPLMGLPLSYVFFLSLFFTAFGGAKKYWWIGILLIPAAAFEIYFDLSHIYFPILLGIAGWVLGYLVLTISNYSTSQTDGEEGKPR